MNGQVEEVQLFGCRVNGDPGDGGLRSPLMILLWRIHGGIHSKFPFYSLICKSTSVMKGAGRLSGPAGILCHRRRVIWARCDAASSVFHFTKLAFKLKREAFGLRRACFWVYRCRAELAAFRGINHRGPAGPPGRC